MAHGRKNSVAEEISQRKQLCGGYSRGGAGVIFHDAPQQAIYNIGRYEANFPIGSACVIPLFRRLREMLPGPSTATVRPRVISPQTGEVRLLEDVVAAHLTDGDCGVLELAGGPLMGK